MKRLTPPALLMVFGLVAMVATAWLLNFERTSDKTEALPVSSHLSSADVRHSFAVDRAAAPSSMPILAQPSAAPSWAIPFGKEFWKKANPPSATSATATTSTSARPVNLSEVIERVSHAFQADPAGVPTLMTPTFSASARSDRLIFRPFENPVASPMAQDQGFQIEFAIQGWRQGLQRFHPSNAPESFAMGNTVQSRLDVRFNLVQHFEASAEGVAVTWILPHAPAAGELVLETKIIGGVHCGETSAGHHFADAVGQARVCIGRATAMDAAGKSWPLETEFEEGLFEVHVPAHILAQATYPLAIDPVISPEFGMDNPVVARASIHQAFPAVAWNGQEYLIVWQDRRDDWQVRGARYTKEGELRDVYGFQINPPDQYGILPRVAASNGEFLVVWSTIGTFSQDIRGAFVRDTASAVPTIEPLLICDAPYDQTEVRVAANDEQFLVAWADARHSVDPNFSREWDVYATRVRRLGGVLDPNGIRVAGFSKAQRLPALATDGAGFLVAWLDDRNVSAASPSAEVYARRITGSGELLDGDGLFLGPGGELLQLAAAFLDGNYLVVWANGLSLMGARVSQSGLVHDAGLVVGVTANQKRLYADLVAGAEAFVSVWDEIGSDNQAGIGATIIPKSGSLLVNSTFRLATERPPSFPKLARAEDQFLVLWNQSEEYNTIYAATLSPSGVFGAPKILSHSWNRQRAPVTAWNGENFLVAWQDNRLSFRAEDIFGVRISPKGELLDPAGIPIGVANGSQFSPAVASHGGDFLVAWADDRNFMASGVDVFGARVGRDGRVLDPAGISICTVTNGQRAVALTANREGYLVVWRDDRNAPADNPETHVSDIYAARVSGSGHVLDPLGFVVSQNPGHEEAPAAASNGTDFLVVWRDWRNVNQSISDIFGARVTASGSVLDPNGIAISPSPGVQRAPEVASNGIDYFVVWRDDRDRETMRSDIYGTRVGSDGSVKDANGLALCSFQLDQREPAVAADGVNFVVFWQDQREAGGSAVYANRVRSDGAILDGAGGFRVLPPDHNDAVLSVASGMPGHFLVITEAEREFVPRTLGSIVNMNDAPILRQARFTPTGTEISWEAQIGATYQVQTTGNFQGWTDIGPQIPAQNAIVTFTDPAPPAQQKFYRVLRIAAP